MDLSKKVFRVLDKTEEYILIVLLSVMTILIFTQVVSRVAYKSLTWTEEIARYLLVWITFMGASLGVKRWAHIGVEAFKLWMPFKLRMTIEYISLALCIFFSSAVFLRSTDILKNQIRSGQVSPAIQIPMWLPYLGVTLGLLLMTIRFIECIFTVKKKVLEDLDSSKIEGGSK